MPWLEQARQSETRRDAAALAQYIHDLHAWGEMAGSVVSAMDQLAPNRSPDFTQIWLRGIQADILCRITWPTHDAPLYP